jgi:hypothetical protein
MCTGLKPLSDRITTIPKLPVAHGTQLKLYCTKGMKNINTGKETAVCNDGTLIPDPMRGAPVCICK